jgi:PAS domain S-box-containing protein
MKKKNPKTKSGEVDERKASGQNYKQLVEYSLQGIAIFQDLKITYANRAFANIFGYTNEELLSISPGQIKKLVHPEDQSFVLDNLKKRLEGLDLPPHYQFRAIGKDGKTIIIELYAQKIDFEGKPAVQAICLDLTEREETRRALEDSEEKFKSIFDNSGLGMSIVDTKGKFITVNKAFAEMFGYKNEEFSRMSIIDLTHPSEIEQSMHIVKGLQLDKDFKTKQFEKRYVKKNGKFFWGIITITQIKDSSGDVSYYIGQLQDITERKKAESKLALYAEELKELNISKDKFFSIISHDLRSPFNALLGISEYTSQFFDELSQAEVKEAIDNLHTSAKKVYNLMQNLLEWTQIQTGRLEVERNKIKLQELLGDSIELYSEFAQKKNIELINKFSGEVYLLADQLMIETVLRNLISNGIKFTKSGGYVNIDCKMNNGLAEISIEDNGVGITPEDQKKLFRIDEQYRKEGTDSEKGTGLGLILCKEFAEKNGGAIFLESKINKGSKFTFTVPLFSNSIE